MIWLLLNGKLFEMTDNHELHIVSERDASGHWSAWLDGESHFACGGPTALSAVNRLLRMIEDQFPKKHHIIASEKSSIDREVFTLKPVTNTPCLECGGTGKSVGLTIIEECAACNGRGFLFN